MRVTIRALIVSLTLLGWSSRVPAQSTTITGTTGTTGTTTTTTVGSAGTDEAASSLPAGRSVWKSQAGATLELDADASGHVTGTLLTGVGCGNPAAPAPASSPGATSAPVATASATRPLVGSAVGNAVAWTVSFLPDCGLVGAWAGHVEAVGPDQQLTQQLTMLWLLATPETPPSFMSTFTGVDVFARQP